MCVSINVYAYPPQNYSQFYQHAKNGGNLGQIIPKQKAIKRTKVEESEELMNENKADPLFPYYCFICGKMAVILKEKLEKLPKRKTDRSTVIDEASMLAKSYLKREKQVIIKRKHGYEKQWRRMCPECEAPLGYQCRPYDEKVKAKENTKYYLYIYQKGLVSSVGDCKVAKAIQASKESKQLVDYYDYCFL
eukprot:TRINITY_DN13350_c0_g2_i1.p5 TRINITY_DN13350_c0_g2~~TRINITY_DN13350_c0_g2_i1.p5  ORF type:complete len:191 (-),score=18.51 TRINITY_DN13350_c0_g2_i1:672-1244(-)